MQVKNKLLVLYILLLVAAGSGPRLFAQTPLSLKAAIQLGIDKYGTVKAKQQYAAASKDEVVRAKRDYLPNLNFETQVDYGTVNMQYGPSYGFGGLGTASIGPPSGTQNWNAAFGSLYLTNVNWDFFAFGRSREKIRTAMATAERDSRDWQQEIFQQEVKVAGAYLNLLAAQRLAASYRENLDLADTFRSTVVERAINDLIPGVDSSQANAEVAEAEIALTNAIDYQQVQENQLIQLLGIPPQHLMVDTFFVTRLPASIPDSGAIKVADSHPSLQYYKSRILLSDQLVKYNKTLSYPTFSLVGIYQWHGSGFGSAYGTQNPGDYSHNLYDGVRPDQGNYLFGLGVTWNFTQVSRISRQVSAQRSISKGLQYEYDLAGQQLVAQLQLSETKMQNALVNYREAPIEVSSAAEAYAQKADLYANGLTTLVDVTEARYALVRAETNRDISYSNVWQALLLKAAATGDINIFLQNF
jgi:outer membrane protein TolC